MCPAWDAARDCPADPTLQDYHAVTFRTLQRRAPCVMALAQEKGYRVEAVRMFQGLSAVLAGNYPRALEILLPPERPARPAPVAAT